MQRLQPPSHMVTNRVQIVAANDNGEEPDSVEAPAPVSVSLEECRGVVCGAGDADDFFFRDTDREDAAASAAFAAC